MVDLRVTQKDQAKILVDEFKTLCSSNVSDTCLLWLHQWARDSSFNFFIIWSFARQLSKHVQLEEVTLTPGFHHFETLFRPSPHPLPLLRPPPLGQVLRSPGLFPCHPIMWNRRQQIGRSWRVRKDFSRSSAHTEQKLKRLILRQFQFRGFATKPPGSDLSCGYRV